MTRNGRSKRNGRPEIATPKAAKKKSHRERATNSSKIGTKQGQKIAITFFKNEFATSLTTQDMTLPELRDLILQRTAATKAKLPWLKLVSFGNKPDPKSGNCLRWDENVTIINGIELDYDAKKMSFDEAVAKLKELNVRCLIYTSPSYTPAAPKWRLLIPLSKPDLRLEWRAAYVARVHGFFGNIFAPESFTLSQSYYYGKAEDNLAADHKAVVIGGDFIDQRGDLEQYQAKGEQEEKKTRGRGGFEAHLKTMGDGGNLAGFNGPLISASSSYARHYGAEFDREELKAKLRDAINQAPKGQDRKPAEIDRYLSDKYLDALIESAVEKFGHGVTVEDFVSYSPQHVYIYKPVRELWVTAGVNANCPPETDDNGKKIPANVWIDRHHSVQQMTWAPGEPMEIPDKLIKEGSGWISRRGVTCFNLYLPPEIVPGDAQDIAPWLDHVHKIYPEDADHIVMWCAQRVQTPQIKINHALVLGGVQGIGKDSILEPVKRAVGPWNWQEISPSAITGDFTGYLKSVILRISEARDLGEVDRFKFYEHTKTVTAAPPDVLRVNEKNLKEHYIPNCVGVVITTNYRTDGIHLPRDDRRHYVAWSDCQKEDFTEVYFNKLWDWYDSGGDRNVAAYLKTLDISGFNPKAPPPKTLAFWAIVDANTAPEEGELADVLDILKNPDAVTLEQLVDAAEEHKLHGASNFLCDRKNRRVIPHRLDGCDYIPIRNKDNQRGLWKIGGQQQVIYVKKELSVSDAIKAARALIRKCQ